MIHSLLFTGHMIDAPGRKNPRFPPFKEVAVKEQIRKYLKNEKELSKGDLQGIASGACGGDILFHELCAELGIPTQMYLALEMEAFKNKSVSFAGNDWEMRYDQLNSVLPVHILPNAKENQNSQNVWERTNLWMLDIALSNGGENMSLIALWDGKGGDGNGGTEHMVNIAKERGARVSIIDINKT